MNDPIPTLPEGMPRRIRLDLCTPAELAIRAAVDAVEAAGADERLTEAVCILERARTHVADYVDGIHSYGCNCYTCRTNNTI